MELMMSRSVRAYCESIDELEAFFLNKVLDVNAIVG